MPVFRATGLHFEQKITKKTKAGGPGSSRMAKAGRLLSIETGTASDLAACVRRVRIIGSQSQRYTSAHLAGSARGVYFHFLGILGAVLGS